MDTETHVSGAELIVHRFGFWPSFEDAEVLTLRFDRGNHMSIVKGGAWNERVAESLEATFFVFDARYSVTAPERKPSEITIRFEPLTDFAMSGFNYQNPIINLGMISSAGVGRIRVQWGGTAMHHEVSFICERVHVLSVVPVAVT